MTAAFFSRRRPVGFLAGLLLVALGVSRCYASGLYNDFDVEGALISLETIHQGGPPRDGIPAIDNPRFIAAKQAGFLDPSSRVIGVHRGGEAKAYPVAILNWHEVVNDWVGGEPVVVTFCPLCGTGVAYLAAVQGRPVHFGVSGLLFNSDVLLYDRETESLWSQLMNQAISGPLKGQRLQMIPSMLTTWSRWRALYPDTQVLSTETGHGRDYARDPYGDYSNSSTLYFPVEFTSHRYHPKERVLGLELDGQSKAYPFAELSQHGETGVVEDRFSGHTLRIEYDAPGRSGRIFNQQGEELAVVNAFWFAWFTFNPETAVYQVEKNR